MTVELKQPLFREEVLQQRASRLYGDVSIAVPISWQLIGSLLLAGVLAAILFLSTASYSRVEIVSGAVVLDKGVAPIVPSRGGVIVGLPVGEGDRVLAGTPLIQIRSEEDLAEGGTAAERVIEGLREQDRRLASQGSLVIDAAAAQQSRLRERIAGLEQEIASLDGQIADQRKLVAAADQDFQQAESLAEKGFLSQRELQAREAALIARRQQLSQLQQARAASTTAISEAVRSMAEASATARAQAAGFESDRAGLAQHMAQTKEGQGYIVRAPVDGTVTAVTARLGQHAAPGQPVMIVVPAAGKPRVELHVPSSAAGFLARGQNVRLAVDAFPYQRFGTLAARITDISSAPTARTGVDGRTVSVFLVTAELSQPWILAFGRRQPLLPGMTLTARIVTDKLTVVEWLFQPIFAVSAR